MVRVSGSITSPAGDTPTLLIQLAEECGPRERIDAMFTGNTINDTEGRAVLHVALRTRQEASIAAVAWDVVQTLVAAEFSQQERHLRRLAKVVTREQQGVADGYHRSR